MPLADAGQGVDGDVMPLALDDLPDPSEWDPSPEEEADLRDRLFKAGEARAGSPTPA